jgi:hypothetical protein
MTEESSFCEQKEAKKLHSFARGWHGLQMDESFFASFFSKKEGSCFLAFWPTR